MQQFINYGLVGIINFIFTAFIYWIFLRVLGVIYPISFSVSWLSGVILTYFINIRWVFKPEELSNLKKKFLKYLIVYLSSYFVNLLLLKVGVTLFNFDPFWYQFFIIPIIVFINFIGIKYWALK